MDISFEFFPPSTSQAEIVLWDSIKLLEPLKPNFVSVTYGAGGTTRNRTHNCVKKIIEETNLNKHDQARLIIERLNGACLNLNNTIHMIDKNLNFGNRRLSCY